MHVDIKFFKINIISIHIPYERDMVLILQEFLEFDKFRKIENFSH